jgi:tetratricopeptide (TPR) repeat protein
VPGAGDRLSGARALGCACLLALAPAGDAQGGPITGGNRLQPDVAARERVSADQQPGSSETAPQTMPAAGDPLEQARAAIDGGRPGDALKRLDGLDARNPRVAELRGVALYHQDDYAGAIAALAPVIDQLPAGSLEGREAVQVLGLSYYLAGRLADALPLLERTAVWAGDNRELAQVLGMAYIQTRRPDDARRALARAFDVGADSAAAHLVAAQMMIRIEFHEMADAELQKALALDPRLPRAHLLLGQNAVFRNRLAEGIGHFQEELAISPADPMALYRLGEALSRQGDWDRAIVALQQSLWINPFFSGPYIVLGRGYLAKGQLQTAEGMLRRAVEYDPNNKAARYQLGQVLQRLGRRDEAKEQLEIAAKLPDR